MGARDEMTKSILQEEGKGGGFLSEIAIMQGLRSKVNFLAVAVALYTGAMYHQTIDRVQDFILYHNQPIAQEYFKDPYGLEIRTPSLEDGCRGVYISHEGSGVSYPLDEDMYPPSGEMVDVLENRMEDVPAGKRHELLEDISDLLERYK